MNTDRFKYKEITNIVLGSFYAVYEVYNELGDGFLEPVTEYGLCVEKQSSKDLYITVKEKISVIIRLDQRLNSC